jgi:hypothetical protein
MPKPPKPAHPGEAKSLGQDSGKLRLYEILDHLNQGFEQVLGQLQQLEKLGLGHQPWKALRVIAEENASKSTSNWSGGSRNASGTPQQ